MGSFAKAATMFLYTYIHTCILLSELVKQNGVKATKSHTDVARSPTHNSLPVAREVSGPAISSCRVRMNTLIMVGRGSSIGTKDNSSPMSRKNMFFQLSIQTMLTVGSDTEIPNHWSHAIKLRQSPTLPPFFNKVPGCSSGAVLTLRLLISYIYGAPSKARNANVVYIWTYVWQR